MTIVITTGRPILGAWWLSGRISALRPQVRRFKPHSSRHVGILGKSFNRNCLYNVMWRPLRTPLSTPLFQDVHENAVSSWFLYSIS